MQLEKLYYIYSNQDLITNFAYSIKQYNNI